MRRQRKPVSKDGSRHHTDEVINTITHLIGAVFSLAGGVILVVYASVASKPWHVAGFTIYVFTLLLMFLASVCHHALEGSRREEEILRTIDYAAIFLLIAGTFTPMCLTFARGPLGWSMLGVVWLLSAIGIAIRASLPKVPKWMTNTLYVCMGWLGVLLVSPVYFATHWQGTAMLIAGGVFYSAGAVVFALEKPNPVPGRFGFHEIWHLCVLLGAACHFFLMFFYVLPLQG